MQAELSCKSGTVKYKTLFWYNSKKDEWTYKEASMMFSCYLETEGAYYFHSAECLYLCRFIPKQDIISIEVDK
jgi:hypothetical protein